MKQWYLFICLLLLSGHQEVSAQTFLGKRIGIDVGSSIMPNVLNPILSNENYFNQWSIFPGGLKLGVNYAVSSRFNFRFEYARHRPQIAGIRKIENYEFEGINQQFVDSFYFSSRNTDINFAVRIYQDFAPVGRYFQMFGGWSKITTMVTPVTSYWNVTATNKYKQLDRHEGLEVTNNAFRAGIGYGRTQMLLRWLYVDFGFKTSLTFADRLFSTDEFDVLIDRANSPDYKTGLAIEYSNDDIRTFSNGLRKNLLNSYLFEIYVNFGLNF